MTRVAEAIEAAWRIESARLIAALTRFTGDLGLAEDLAQDALEQERKLLLDRAAASRSPAG